MSNLQYYVLDGQETVPVEDHTVWSASMSATERGVGATELGWFKVSTVFLGMDHNFLEDGRPLLFETIVFDWRRHSCATFRYSTFKEAESGHEKVCVCLSKKLVRKHCQRWLEFCWMDIKEMFRLSSWI